MFNALYFTYDGVHSGNYGLIIADFNDSAVVETDVFSPSLTTNKTPYQKRFFSAGINYENPPQFQFSIISEQIITDENRRAILSWLVGRDSFKTLRIHQPDLEDYHYRCIFTDAAIIYVNGYCHGFRLTANLDSPYQYAAESSVSINGSGGAVTVEITNNSDITDDYVYPDVIITSRSGSVSIVNETDDPTRKFEFVDLTPGEVLTVDNELRHIKSNNSVERLSNFSKNWLRLRRGVNKLSVTVNGNVEIRCPAYVMMGF